MALTGSAFPQGGGNVGFPQTGGIANRETPQEAKARIAKEDAEQARLNDPYGARPSEPGVMKKLVRVVKRARVQNQQNSNANGSNGTAGPRSGRAPGGAAGRNTLATYMESQSWLTRASVQHENKQAQNPQNPTANNFSRGKMLNGLSKCISLDYAWSKINDNDKTCRKPAEDRQLLAVVQTMLPSNSKETGGRKKADGSDDRPLSPQAFARQKTLMRQLAGMSEPNPRLPDDLPADYQPVERFA